jgi:hypothetical protein
MTEPQATTPSQTGHEANVVTSKFVLMFGAVLATVTVVILLLMGGLLRTFDRREARSDPPPPLLAITRQPPPEPRLQVAPMQDLQAVQASADAMLQAYAWVDRNSGIVRIPIDRAIDLLVERGLSMPAGE